MRTGELMNQALRASLLAGDALMQVYGTNFEVRYKDDRSPVTEADTLAHKVLSFRLSGDIPFLSEESSQIPYRERARWNVFWLVDPLDGTKEYIRRSDEFSVNVALIEQEIPILGVVYLPARRELFFGTRGGGSYRIRDGDVESIAAKERLLECALQRAVPLPVQPACFPQKIRVVQSLSHMTREEAEFISGLRAVVDDLEAVSAGSSLKFCRVAEGSADIYPRFGPTMEWDTAAGQCIAEAAGCEVLNVAGLSPVRYNRCELRNEAFVVLGQRIKEKSELRDAVLARAHSSLASAGSL